MTIIIAALLNFPFYIADVSRELAYLPVSFIYTILENMNANISAYLIFPAINEKLY